MREILFRGKSKNYRLNDKDKHWVYGNLVRGEVLFPERKEECFIVELRNRGDCTYEIIPETLYKYTGLKDKNGNRIWENDIVSCEHEKYPDDNPSEVYPLLPESIKYTRNYAVEFINTGSSYGYRLRNKSIHFMLTGNVIKNHKIEVVGNIFDNPELLKGE